MNFGFVQNIDPARADFAIIDANFLRSCFRSDGDCSASIVQMATKFAVAANGCVISCEITATILPILKSRDM